LACIKARFSLAIKVEIPLENAVQGEGDESPDSVMIGNGEKRMVLGYLPLDSIVNVEESCPDVNPSNKKEEQADGKSSEPEELEMIVLFECGKLGFTFKRDENFYLSAIRGVVNLGKYLA